MFLLCLMMCLEHVQSFQAGHAKLFNTHNTITMSMDNSSLSNATIEWWMLTLPGSSSDSKILSCDNGLSLLASPNLGIVFNSLNCTSACRTTNDTWTHYAVVWEQDSGQVRFHLNGQLVQTLFQTNNNSLSFSSSVTIGSGFHGILDELRIWARTKTLDEIQLTWNRTSLLSITNLSVSQSFDRPIDPQDPTCVVSTAPLFDGPQVAIVLASNCQDALCLVNVDLPDYANLVFLQLPSPWQLVVNASIFTLTQRNVTLVLDVSNNISITFPQILRTSQTTIHFVPERPTRPENLTLVNVTDQSSWHMTLARVSQQGQRTLVWVHTLPVRGTLRWPNGTALSGDLPIPTSGDLVFDTGVFQTYETNYANFSFAFSASPASVLAMVSILRVPHVNTVPTPTNASVTTTLQGEAVVALEATDPDWNANLSFVVVGSLVLGTIVETNQSLLRYQAFPGAQGQETVLFVANDGQEWSNSTGVLEITIVEPSSRDQVEQASVNASLFVAVPTNGRSEHVDLSTLLNDSIFTSNVVSLFPPDGDYVVGHANTSALDIRILSKEQPDLDLFFAVTLWPSQVRVRIKLHVQPICSASYLYVANLSRCLPCEAVNMSLCPPVPEQKATVTEYVFGTLLLLHILLLCGVWLAHARVMGTSDPWILSALPMVAFCLLGFVPAHLLIPTLVSSHARFILLALCLLLLMGTSTVQGVRFLLVQQRLVLSRELASFAEEEKQVLSPQAHVRKRTSMLRLRSLTSTAGTYTALGLVFGVGIAILIGTQSYWIMLGVFLFFWTGLALTIAIAWTHKHKQKSVRKRILFLILSFLICAAYMGSYQLAHYRHLDILLWGFGAMFTAGLIRWKGHGVVFAQQPALSVSLAKQLLVFAQGGEEECEELVHAWLAIQQLRMNTQEEETFQVDRIRFVRTFLDEDAPFRIRMPPNLAQYVKGNALENRELFTVEMQTFIESKMNSCRLLARFYNSNKIRRDVTMEREMEMVESNIVI